MFDWDKDYVILPQYFQEYMALFLKSVLFTWASAL